MNVLITGAAGGLGRALAIECARRGYDLILTDVNGGGLISIRDGLIRQYKSSVITECCDLTKDDEVNALVKRITDRAISVDMLLNVAGIDFEGGFLDRDYNRITSIIRLNIEATLRITHAVLEIKRAEDKLHIVFVSSLASMYPMPLKATYAASKRFLLDFSIALRQELKNQNVTVMSICPGGLPTTQEALLGISSQGFFGNATTNHLESLANKTITKALKGKSVYIPGILNRSFCILGKIVPSSYVARLLHARWSKAQKQWLNLS